MSDTITVHMIGQAHIDPIWLWGWTQGVDEVLATCRTACDLLDAYPEFIFTRGEAWSYAQVERLDPALFDRIRAFVATGRWEIAGGWWLQPDCNFPTEAGFQRQIAVGQAYFRERFGQAPAYGYNVDSFGHSAALPRLLREAGQTAYVMMRPQEHERALPARCFRWRGEADSPTVTVFRIAGSYNTGPHDIWEGHLRRACEDLPAGMTDTMCFYGVGDHGGGPTAALIAWIRDHRDAFPGLRLEFSSPGRFFAVIADQVEGLPLVEGELQYHAIGCYSVMRELKTQLRAAEHRLRQAEVLAPAADLRHAWERVAFAQFHDILGGTSIASAYPPVYARLGEALTAADDTVQYGVREKVLALPDDPLQRVILYNASDSPFDGYTEVEPWMGWRSWRDGLQLLDEDGTPVAFQVIHPEALIGAMPRLVVRTTLAPNAMRVLKIAPGETPAPKALVTAGTDWLEWGDETAVGLRSTPELVLPGGMVIQGLHLTLIPDLSDNWSHGIDRFPEGPVTSATWNAPCVLHQGPLMAALYQTGQIGDSTLAAEWRVYADLPAIDLTLQVHWRAQMQLLKLVLPLLNNAHQSGCATRLDGIAGGSLRRENDGKEYPLQDWTLAQSPAGPLGIVCPDAYALDALPHRLRVTLLRSPYLTHHDPWKEIPPNAPVADQGVHTFRFRFLGGPKVTPERLRQEALMLHRPLVAVDWTKGMPRQV
jgi:alpha-mannosidase